MNFTFITGGDTLSATAIIDQPSDSDCRKSDEFALYCGKACQYIEQHCSFPQKTGISKPELSWIAVAGNPVMPRPGHPNDLARPIRPAQVPALLTSHGLDFLHRLSGQYIIVLVFPESHRAICIRDQAGSRSCYWAKTGSRFILSDSAAQVSWLARTGFEEDFQTISEWLLPSSAWRMGKSAFAGVAELQPGERLILQSGRIKLHRSPIALGDTEDALDHREWIARFAAQLKAGVINCLPATGNPSLMLSGGLDSGPAAALAAPRLQADGRNLNVVSWYIRSVPEASEWAWIKQLSSRIGAQLHPICGDDYPPFSELDADMVDVDLPNYNAFRPLALACYRRAVEVGSKVVINASSGDSLYPHPRFALYDAIRHRQLLKSIHILKVRAAKVGVLGLHRDPVIRYLGSRLLGPRGRAVLPGWLTQHAIDSIPATEIWPPEAHDHPYPQHIAQLFGPRAASAIAHENRFSERFGLQRRDPYTHFELLKLMANMPHSISNGIGTTKWVMREAMRGILPEDFRTKPRTGILSEFYWRGYQTNLPAIRDLLSTNRDWQEWVRKDYLENVLKHTRPETKDALLVGKCIGYTLWRQKLKEQRVSKP